MAHRLFKGAGLQQVALCHDIVQGFVAIIRFGVSQSLRRKIQWVLLCGQTRLLVEVWIKIWCTSCCFCQTTEYIIYHDKSAKYWMDRWRTKDLTVLFMYFMFNSNKMKVNKRSTTNPTKSWWDLCFVNRQRANTFTTNTYSRCQDY